jgi:glutamate racemase
MRSRNKRVGVLATPATLASDKYKRLIETHARDAMIIPQACPGLAREIEKGSIDTAALRELVETFAEPLIRAEVDTVVLGCTHYPFVAPLFRAALGDAVEVIDTAAAVAEQTARLCALRASANQERAEISHSQIRLWSSGDPRHLAQVARAWLDLDVTVSSLDAS